MKRVVNALSTPIEESVRRLGVTPQAVWLDQRDTLKHGVRRCEAVLRMIENRTKFSILDLGCGPGFTLDYLRDRYEPDAFSYCGIDISEPLISAARNRHPTANFNHRDIIADPMPDQTFDFTAINGVLTAKYMLSHEEMEAFACELLQAAWRSTRIALSFNVMSIFVDWTREDLFHWPLDHAIGFCSRALSRHCNVIADYGLYEYTVQVLRDPVPAGASPAAWNVI